MTAAATIKVEVHHYLHFEGDTTFQTKVLKQLEKIMGSVQETTDKLNEISSTLDKVGAESTANLALVQQLKDQIAGLEGIPQSVVDLVDQILTKSKSIDDMTPDA